MAQTTRMLILAGAAALLLACGGGSGSSGGAGGGAGSGGGSPGPMGVEQTLPPKLSGREGDDSELKFQALGNDDIVTLSYRPEGGTEVAQLAIGPGLSETVRVPAGIAPDITIIASPARQHCRLSVDWQFQVMPREEVVSIECADRITVPDDLRLYPLQWAALPGVEVTDIQADLRVELSAGASVTELPFIVTDNTLLFVIPEASAGTGQVRFWHRNVVLASVSTEVLALPELDSQTFLDGWFASLFEDVEAALPVGSVGEWQAFYSQHALEFRQKFEALSQQEKDSVVRYLWANLSGVNEIVNPLQTQTKAMRGFAALSAGSVAACGQSAIKLAAFTALIVYGSVAGAELLGSLGLTGPAGAAVAVGGGLAIAAAVISLADKGQALARKTVETCAVFRGVLAGAEQDEATQRARVAGRMMPMNSPAIVSTRTLKLVHEQPYQTALRVRRTLSPNAAAAMRGLQRAMQPVSGLFGERLDWLYLFDFDARLPLQPSVALTVSGATIAAHELAVSADSMLSIKLGFATTPWPDRPVPFRITGELSAQDDWLAKQVPVSLDMEGYLSGKPPVAFDVVFNITPNEVFRLTAPTEFATSVTVTRSPRFGRVFSGVGLGEFHYFPDEHNTEEDSFEYEAANGFGAERGVVTLQVNDRCQLNEGSTWMWTCVYRFDSEGLVFTVHTGADGGYPWGRADKLFRLQRADDTPIAEHMIGEEYFEGALETVHTRKGGLGPDGLWHEENRNGCGEPSVYCGPIAAARSLVPLTISQPHDAASVYRYFEPYFRAAGVY